tara:strand:+ start:2102 stop:3223 length:1122 start_codon:yes stop_codon:yes gene_type:complete
MEIKMNTISIKKQTSIIIDKIKILSLLFFLSFEMQSSKVYFLDFGMTNENKEKFKKQIQAFPDPYTFKSIVSSEDGIQISPNYKRIMNELSNLMIDCLSPDAVRLLREKSKNFDFDSIIIKNLPHDDYTPSFKAKKLSDRSDAKNTKVSEYAILGLASLMGYYVSSLKEEHEGRIIHNISPVEDSKKSKSSIGSVQFNYHTDDSYASFFPKMFILMGIEPDFESGSKTSILPIADILREMPLKELAELKKPQYWIRSNESVEGTVDHICCIIEEETTSENQKIFRFRFIYDEDSERIVGINEKANQALKVLNSIIKRLEKSAMKFNLQKGEAIILNNGIGLDNPGGLLHGRIGTIKNPTRFLQRGKLYINQNQ